MFVNFYHLLFIFLKFIFIFIFTKPSLPCAYPLCHSSLSHIAVALMDVVLDGVTKGCGFSYTVVGGDGPSAPSLCRTRKTPRTSATANISPIIHWCYMEGWQQSGKHGNERTERIPRDRQSQSSVAEMGFNVTGSKLLGFPHCSGGRTALPHVAFCLEERINEVFDVKTQMKANMTKFLFKLSLFTNILFWQSPPWAISAASSPSC